MSSTGEDHCLVNHLVIINFAKPNFVGIELNEAQYATKNFRNELPPITLMEMF